MLPKEICLLNTCRSVH